MHIINGDCAAGSFWQAYQLPRETIFVFRDVLSCGALKSYTDVDSWFAYRTGYWSRVLQENGLGAINENDKIPQDFYHHLEDLKSEKKIELWLGCALSDQLLLVFIVMLFDRYGLDFEKLKIRQYLAFDKKQLTVVGLGVLSPDDIKQLAPEPQKLREAEVTYCLNAWDAVISDTPDKLQNILIEKHPVLPLLHKALKNLIYRYPDVHKGLSHFDEVILKQAKLHFSKATRIIGNTLEYDRRLEDTGNIHELDTVGDLYLFSRLKRLAKCPTPLLELNTTNESMRETTVKITTFGSEVLQDKHNVVNVNGINDWVCGVHLSAENIWFRDGETIVRTD